MIYDRYVSKDLARRLIIYSIVAAVAVILVVLRFFNAIETKDLITFLLTIVGLVLTAEYVYITQKMNLRRSLETAASKEFIAATMNYRKALYEYMRLLHFPFKPVIEDEDDIFDFPKHMMQQRIATTNALKGVVDTWDELRKAVETNRLALEPLMLMFKYLSIKHDDIEKKASSTDKKVMEYLKPDADDKDVDRQNRLYKSFSEQVAVQGFYAYDIGREALNYFQSDVFGFKLEARKGASGLNKKTAALSKVATQKAVYDLAYEQARGRGWSEAESKAEARQTAHIHRKKNDKTIKQR